CMAAGLVGGKGYAVDASLIEADANKSRSIPGTQWDAKNIDPEAASRAAKEYLATLDDAAYGAASSVTPKFISPSDPAAQWTGAMKSAAFFAYADNYLIDVKFGIIMDVEASRAIRQAEVGASRTMIERTEATFGIKPEWLTADTAYGSAPNLDWLVNTKDIAPYIPVIDKSQREDGTFSREDFVYDAERDTYTCPAGRTLTTTGHVNADNGIRYIASVPVCRACPLKTNCCPNMPSRRIVRDVHEAARDVALACDCVAPMERSSSSRLPPSHRTCDASPSSPHVRRRDVCPRAFREHCVVAFVQVGGVESLQCPCAKGRRFVRSVQRQRNPVSAPTSATKSARSRHAVPHV